MAHRANDPQFSNDRCTIGPVTFSQNTWQTLTNEINTYKEFGGNFKFDHNTRTLSIDPATIVRGEHDNVTIPHGRYEFHTHPAKCKGTACALGIPSVADIKIHLEDVNTDNFANFVFEKDGMWIMTPSLFLRGSGKQDMLQAAQKHASKMIQLLKTISHKNYATRYESFRNEWLETAKSKGIHMRFIPWNNDGVAPSFVVPVPCA